MTFTNRYRESLLQQITSTTYDVLVIGGGITAAGIVLDAQARGLKACLIEMQDFAEGTSSRSTKLIHGGLRYLKQKEFKLVAEVGKERTIVSELAPHLSIPEQVLVPLTKEGSIGKLGARIGMKLYDWLAGVHRDDKHKILSPSQTLAKEPQLNPQGLKGAIYYTEYKTDDARLTLENIKKAVELGAVALNYAKVTSLLYQDGEVSGVQVEDLITHQQASVNARYVINATGPWTDDVCGLDGENLLKKLHLTKGVHLVFDHAKFPIQQAVYFDVFDKRMVFAIPNHGKTYVGTTDTFYQGDIQSPTVTQEDVQYLLQAIQGAFPTQDLKPTDIEASWAGLRPLIMQKGKSASEISRKDEMFISDSKLVSIAGGKLTGYRKMAEKVMDLIAHWELKKGKKIGENKTAITPLSGGDVGGVLGFKHFKKEFVTYSGLDKIEAQRIVEKFGSNALTVENLIENYVGTTTLTSFLLGSLLYGLHHEMVYAITDFFTRRTGLTYFDVKMVEQHQVEVARIMSEFFNWTPKEKQTQLENMKEALAAARLMK